MEARNEALKVCIDSNIVCIGERRDSPSHAGNLIDLWT